MTTNVTTTHDASRIEVEARNDVIEFGWYFQYSPKPSDDGLLSNRLSLLVESAIYMVVGFDVNMITQEYHNVTLLIPKGYHGAKRQEKCTVLYSEFVQNFKRISDDVAAGDRATWCKKYESMMNSAALEARTNVTDSMMMLKNTMQSPSEAVQNELGKIQSLRLLEEFSHVTTQTPAQLIESAGSNTPVVAVLNNQRQVIQAMQMHAEALNDVFVDCSKSLLSIKTESIEAMMAKTKFMSEHVSDINRRMDTIQTYLGVDVEVEMLCDGPVSMSGSPFTVYANLVYMDEELTTLWFGDFDELDHRKQEMFHKELKTNDKFLHQILPHERMIVSVKYTRDLKKYETANIMESYYHNSINKQVYLLVRDGGSVFAVYSKLKYMDRLFPTQKSMDAFFSNMTPDNIALVDRQNTFTLHAEQFKNLTYLLQGIADGNIRHPATSEMLIGSLPHHVPGKSFVDDTLCQSNIRFLDDETNLIGNASLADPDKLIRGLFSNESSLASGDLIIYEVPHDVEYSDCPAMFNNNLDKCWYPCRKLNIEPIRDAGYKTRFNGTKYHQFTVRLLLEKHNTRNYDVMNKTGAYRVQSLERYIPLYHLTPSLLNMLIENRRLRPSLVRYMSMLNTVKRVMNGLAPAFKALMNVGAPNEDVAYQFIVQELWTMPVGESVDAVIAEINARALVPDLEKLFKKYHHRVSQLQMLTSEQSRDLAGEGESVYGLFWHQQRLVCLVDATRTIEHQLGLALPVRDHTAIFKMYAWDPVAKRYSFDSVVSSEILEMTPVDVRASSNTHHYIRNAGHLLVNGSATNRTNVRQLGSAIDAMFQCENDVVRIQSALDVLKTSKALMTASHADDLMNGYRKNWGDRIYTTVPLFGAVERLDVDKYGDTVGHMSYLSPVGAVLHALHSVAMSEATLEMVRNGINDVIVGTMTSECLQQYLSLDYVPYMFEQVSGRFDLYMKTSMYIEKDRCRLYNDGLDLDVVRSPNSGK